MSLLGHIKRRALSFVVPRFLSYGEKEFREALHKLGLSAGDVVMVHASWSPFNGFTGRPLDMIRALQETVTRRGLLAMPSLTYTDSTKDFLARTEVVDLRRSPSRMGLLSEVFRRGRSVVRSLSPTHSVLAWGDGAAAFIQGHEHCTVPFGAGSPFERLLELDGKILCIDAPLESITFTHFIEDRLAHHLPVNLYEEKPIPAVAIDSGRRRHEISVYVISDEARKHRREQRLWDTAQREGILNRLRLGKTRLTLISTSALIHCARRLIVTGAGLFSDPTSATSE